VPIITHPLLYAWIDHIFDHPVPADPNATAWYQADDAPKWQGSLELVPTLTAEMCEHSGELLARFSDAQLDQGFWYFVGCEPPGFIKTLVDSEIPLAERVRAIRSFTPLFEQVMAARCSPLLSHLGEPPEGSLNDSCFIWWDLIWHELCLLDDKPEPRIAVEIVVALGRQLTIPHDACRESALHGIGHWVKTIPEVAGLVDDFLAANPDLRPELVEYAKNVKTGRVM
jgi:hypothetical protein